MNKFRLGKTVMTQWAMTKISQSEAFTLLARHASGDWGDVCQEDAQLNDEAVDSGDRILSIYRTVNGTKLYVITEWDRSYTTILLPEEY